MNSDTLSFDSEHLQTLAAVVTKDLRHLMSHVTPKLREGLIIPLKKETASLDAELNLLKRWQAKAHKIAEDTSDSISHSLKENLEISKALTEALGKKGTAAVADLVSAAVGAALRRELETRLLPIFSETLNSSEISRVGDISAEAAKDLEILSRKIELLETAASRLAACADAQRKETEKLNLEIESTNFQEIIDEVIKPLLGQSANLRGLIDGGQFEAAISLALNSQPALEEFLTESPESWLEKFPGPAQKRALALATARTLADGPVPADAAVSRVEWIFEIILSLSSAERPGNFFEELGEQLSLVDSRGDKKLAAKISQCLRLVRSLQW